MRKLILLSLISIVLSDVSFIQAQTSHKFDFWKKGAYYRGFNVVADQTNKTLQDFIDLKAAGATFVYIGTLGFRAVEAPYTIDSFNINRLDEFIGYCHTAELPYALTIREGPGRRDVYLEGTGSPLSTLWTNSDEQKSYASMLREIADRYKNDPLFIGMAPMTEPDPLGHGNFYVDTATLGKLLRQNSINLQSIIQLCVDSIRSTSSDIPLLIQGPAFAAPEFIPLAPRINDLYVVYEFHSYRPREYVYDAATDTLSYPGFFISYIEKKLSVLHNKEYLKDSVFKYIYDRQKETGAPIFMGEFGIQFPHMGSPHFLSDLTSIDIENGWHFAYWDWRRPAGGGWNYELMPPPHWETVLQSFQGNLSVAHTKNSGDSIRISPNPCSATTTISIFGENAPPKLCIFDILGNKRKEIQLKNSLTEILTDDLPSGEYIVVVQSVDGVTAKRLVVAK